jgi:SAM-dependent methyltransferase
MPAPHLDFGYPWWLNYGHLAAFAVLAAGLLCAIRFRWAKWLVVVLGVGSAWAAVVFVMIRFGVDINRVASLPTENFMQAGTGRVLDIGAGTGRSAIMVLMARPQATLVASDLFGSSFEEHFGPGESPQERLRRNLEAAGVSSRATIETADMRRLPFDDATFDAIVSAYAVDHLNREGSKTALKEAARVLKPGGDFLLMVVENDFWGKLAFGPALTHGGTRGRPWWAGAAKDAGFTIREEGSLPVTTYLLLRR